MRYSFFLSWPGVFFLRKGLRLKKLRLKKKKRMFVLKNNVLKTFLLRHIKLWFDSIVFLKTILIEGVRFFYSSYKEKVWKHVNTQQKVAKKPLHAHGYGKYYKSFRARKVYCKYKLQVGSKNKVKFPFKKLKFVHKNKIGFIRPIQLACCLDKNIQESLTLNKKTQGSEEATIFLAKNAKHKLSLSYQDSETDLYAGDVLYACYLYYKITNAKFLKTKMFLPRKHFLMFRRRVREVQGKAKRKIAALNDRLKVLKVLKKEMRTVQSFKKMKNFSLKKFLKKEKKEKKKDWYETWENMFSLIRTLELIREREERLKERGRKIQEVKKKNKNMKG